MGFVYAFLTEGFDKHGNRILKVGRTINWNKRREAYTGLDAPDDVTLLVKETSHAELVEKTLKRILTEMFEIHSGYERFIIPTTRTSNIISWISSTIDLHPLDANINGMTYSDAQNLKRKSDEDTHLYINDLEAENATLRCCLANDETADETDLPLTNRYPKIASNEWKELSQEDRIKSVEPIWTSIRMSSLRKHGVRGMVHKYVKMILPLENICDTQGYRWRDTYYLGRQCMRKFCEMVTNNYEPIICAIIEHMNVNHLDIWTAADHFEKLRESKHGAWHLLLITDEVKRFKTHESRKHHLKQLTTLTINNPEVFK